MITHLLDLFHLITSFSESIDQPECPQPTLMHSNPHACIQFMRALDHYQQQLRWQKALLITSHLLQQQKKQRLEKGQQFCRQLASLQQISALDRYQKQQQAYYQALCWQLLLLGHFALVLHCSFLLPGLPWPFTHQLSSPAPYQAPISPLAEQRHTKTLTLSLHRNLAHSHPRALVLKKVTLPHLELTTVSYEAMQMVASMQDGTEIIHRISTTGQSELLIKDPPFSDFSKDEQSARRADFLAVLFYQAYLLAIPDHHHVDFWCPANGALTFLFDLPSAPYHGMAPEHRLLCRVLYHLVHLGLAPIVQGHPLTVQRLNREHWAACLFDSNHTPINPRCDGSHSISSVKLKQINC